MSKSHSLGSTSAAEKIPDAEDPKAPPIEARRDVNGAPKKFRVAHGDLTKEVVAADSREAWALFCDANKSWPSPKTGKVEEIAA